MSNIIKGGPQKSAGAVIEDLPQKPDAKKTPAAPVVAQPGAKKIPIVPPIQGTSLTKRQLPAVPKQPVGPNPHPLPKQPVSKVAPPLDLQDQMSKEFFGVSFQSLPVSFQKFIATNIGTVDIDLKFREFVESSFEELKSDFMSLTEKLGLMKAEDGSVFKTGGLKERDLIFYRGIIQNYAKFRVQNHIQQLSALDFFGASHFEGGEKSTEFRTFFLAFMTSLSDEKISAYTKEVRYLKSAKETDKLSYVRGLAIGVYLSVYDQLKVNAKRFETFGNMNNYNDWLIELKYTNDGIPEYLFALHPIIGAAGLLRAVSITEQGKKLHSPSVVIPETVTKLNEMKAFYAEGGFDELSLGSKGSDLRKKFDNWLSKFAIEESSSESDSDSVSSSESTSSSHSTSDDESDSRSDSED